MNAQEDMPPPDSDAEAGNGRLADRTVADFVRAAASKQPTPGGGAVAAVTGALGAALGAMVLNYTVGRKKYAEHADLHDGALTELTNLRQRLLDLADADAAAYRGLSDLWSLDENDPVRRERWADAVDAAIDAPSRILGAAEQALHLAEQLCGRSNRMLRSDLAIAAELAETAMRAAAWNVRANLPLLDDNNRIAGLEQWLDDTLADARQTLSTIESHCQQP